MRTNWTPWLTIGLALILASAAGAQQREWKKPTPEERQERLVQRMWWNQDAKVNELNLTAGQRTKMTGFFTEFLATQQPQEDQRVVFQAFGDALGSGDAEGTAAARDHVIETISSNMEQQLDMMIQVVGVLNAEQLSKLATEFPGLLNRPWLRMGNAGMARDGREGRAAPRRQRN